MRSSAAETLADDLLILDLLQVLIDIELLCVKLTQQLVLHASNGHRGSGPGSSVDLGRSG